MSHLFISDLHLDESRRDITDAYLHFLNDKAADAESLYILGDFFEVWLGDDHDTPFNRQVIDSLASLKIPTYVMHGNRDFLLGQDFCDAAGVELLPDPTTVTLYNRTFLLMHGDSLCTRDVEYMKAREMLRNPAVQQDLLGKSLPERAAIAEGARADSKKHTRETADDIMDVTPEEVTKFMQSFGVSKLIHGHTHRPYVHRIETGERIVLGDWDTKGWYLEVNAEGENLRAFDIS